MPFGDLCQMDQERMNGKKRTPFVLRQFSKYSFHNGGLRRGGERSKRNRVAIDAWARLNPATAALDQSLLDLDTVNDVLYVLPLLADIDVTTTSSLASKLSALFPTLLSKVLDGSDTNTTSKVSDHSSSCSSEVEEVSRESSFARTSLHQTGSIRRGAKRLFFLE
jgi:hypothetical protein